MLREMDTFLREVNLQTLFGQPSVKRDVLLTEKKIRSSQEQILSIKEGSFSEGDWYAR